MNSPEIAKIGLGNVDTARLKKSIEILVEANELPRTPTVDEIFTPASSCRRSRICRRSCSEAQPRLLEQRAGAQSNATAAYAKTCGRDHGLKLEGRVAMITGPAKGMGAAITMAFAAEGRGLR